MIYIYIYIYVQYLYIMGNKDETGAEIIGGFMVKEPLGLDVSPGVFSECIVSTPFFCKN